MWHYLKVDLEKSNLCGSQNKIIVLEYLLFLTFKIHISINVLCRLCLCQIFRVILLYMVILFSSFSLDQFLLQQNHRDVEDHFIKNVVMFLSEGLAGTKINCTEVIVCGRKCFISFRDVLQSGNDSKDLEHLMLVICIKISQV